MAAIWENRKLDKPRGRKTANPFRSNTIYCVTSVLKTSRGKSIRSCVRRTRVDRVWKSTGTFAGFVRFPPEKIATTTTTSNRRTGRTRVTCVGEVRAATGALGVWRTFCRARSNFSKRRAAVVNYCRTTASFSWRRFRVYRPSRRRRCGGKAFVRI